MGFLRRRFRRTSLITIFCAAILAGLGLARLRWPMPTLVLVVLCLAAPLLVRKKSVVSVLMLIVLGVSFGLWRGGLVMNKLALYRPLIKKPVTVTGIAQGDAIYGDKTQLSFDIGSIRLQKPYQQNLSGLIKVQGLGVPMVYKGDLVSVTAQLYPTRGARQASLSFATLRVLERGHSWIDTWRRKFTAGAQSALPEPQASFGLGLLIGQRSLLPKAVNDQLAAVGLTHLVAVSGYNLTILIDTVRRVLGKRSKYQTTIGALVLVALFVACTGMSASIVRAAIVSALGLAAWYYGRTVKPLLLILLTAAITAVWNPVYLWSDIGWYLSFLAFFGVLVIAPLLARRLTRKSKQPTAIVALLCESFAAQIMTVPIIMYIFGRASLIGLVANILTVPLVPISMLATLVAGLAGVLLPAVAGWFAWPAKLLLSYELDVAGAFSRVPHAVLNRSISVKAMLLMYLLIACLTLLLWFKTPRSRGKITDETGVF
jgi:ComEC/Rec2-related protein